MPDADTSIVLATALRQHGATCPIAVTAHTDRIGARYDKAVADGTISVVLHPFRDAADDAITTLRRLENTEPEMP